MAKRTYTQEEVDAILSKAIEQQSKDAGKLSHEELVAAAAEVGISRDAIDTAARDVTSPASREKQDDKTMLATGRRRAWRALLRHVVVFAIVNAMLAFINFATTPAFLWCAIVFFGWGIGVAMQLLSILFADEERTVSRERRRRDRRARKERWRKRGQAFERAVDEGVRVLLDAADKGKGTGRVRVAAHASEPEAESETESEPESESEMRR